MTDPRTAHHNLPLPGSTLAVDLPRLQLALRMIDQLLHQLGLQVASTLTVDTLAAALQGYASAGHKHTPASIGAAPAVHTHAGIGPLSVPSQSNIARNAQGQVTEVSSTLEGLPMTETIARDAAGAVTTITTRYDGRTVTLSLHRNAAGDVVGTSALWST